MATRMERQYEASFWSERLADAYERANIMDVTGLPGHGDSRVEKRLSRRSGTRD